jgi:hypothetical protein
MKYLVLAFFAVALNANAADPTFSYWTELGRFGTAVVPTAAQLTGDWMAVGIAVTPNAPSSYSGYWPDGKLPDSQRPGHAFYDVINFSPVQNAPRLMVMKETGVDIVSGKVIVKLDPISVTETATGFQFEYPFRTGTCSLRTECRIETATGTLLCGASNNADYSIDHCEIESIDPVILSGYVRKP